MTFPFSPTVSFPQRAHAQFPRRRWDKERQLSVLNPQDRADPGGVPGIGRTDEFCFDFGAQGFLRLIADAGDVDFDGAAAVGMDEAA
jgi:hypothetical protein